MAEVLLSSSLDTLPQPLHQPSLCQPRLCTASSPPPLSHPEQSSLFSISQGFSLSVASGGAHSCCPWPCLQRLPGSWLPCPRACFLPNTVCLKSHLSLSVMLQMLLIFYCFSASFLPPSAGSCGVSVLGKLVPGV